MEGTNPSDKKERSHDKKVTHNGMATNNANSPHHKDKQGADNKDKRTESPVEQSEHAPEKEKSPAMGHAIDREKSESAPSDGEQQTPEVTPEDTHLTATAATEVTEPRGKTPGDTVARTAAFSLIEMLTHTNENLRLEAIESLLKVGDKSLSYAFASAMKDESFRVRLGALRGLYKFGGDSATEYLITALEDKHPDVRRRAIIYLGWMRKPEVLPFITAALADHSSRVRKVATYALGDLKDSSAVPYLMKALQDTDPEVIKGALAALKRITGKSFPVEQQSDQAGQHAIIRQWNQWWKKQDK